MKAITLLALLLASCSIPLPDLSKVPLPDVSKPSSSAIQLLVPLYDLSYANQVVDASRSKKIGIILNVVDGPGKSKDKGWDKVINSLKGNNAVLFGYIDMVTWQGDKSTQRPSSDIQDDADKWGSLYGINQFFFDDWQKNTSVPESATSIANPGYDMKTTCRYTLVWETKGYLKSKPSSQNHQAVFAMKEADFRPALELAKKRGVEWFYAVAADDNWQAYDNLPPYFDEMVSSL